MCLQSWHASEQGLYQVTIVYSLTTLIHFLFTSSGLYGVAVILPGYDSLILTGGSNTSVPVSNTTQTVECVFSPSSPFYPEDMRLVLRHIDELVPVCANLAYYWTHLVANMSLCFIGCVLSAVSAIASCATPCFEDRYQRKWSPQAES